MKKILDSPIWSFFIVFLGFMAASACSDDFPGNVESSQETVLEAIKILNAGADGAMVVEGDVDENGKTISFPRLDPETDFSAIRFEIDASQGATLEKETYEISFAEGESEKTFVVKVVNEPRYREYLVTIRLLVPVFGADFSKAAVHDYSANEVGNPIYEAFTGLLTRGTGFDGEHVLVINRGETGVHLLRVNDLKNNVVDRISLNTSGVIGGTYPMNMGAQVNGHTYVTSLSTSGASPLKIYHWTDPSAAPEEIANINVGSIPNAGARHGDNVSFSLDENGNGYVYFLSLQGPILRLQISNYTQVTAPYVVAGMPTYAQWSSYLRVGTLDSYLVTGNQHQISVADGSGTVAMTMGDGVVPKNATDARVVTFNGERYLIVVTVARSGEESAKLYVYNITRGDSIVEALTILQDEGPSAVFEHVLSGTTSIAPASQTGFFVEKDEAGNDTALLLYAAAADAGFAVIEVPKKELED